MTVTTAPAIAGQQVGTGCAEIDLTVDSNKMTVGDQNFARVTVTRDAGPVSGEVEFLVDLQPGTTVELGEGKAAFSLSNLTAGDHTITVRYENDRCYVPNEDHEQVSVGEVAPTETASPSPSVTPTPTPTPSPTVAPTEGELPPTGLDGQTQLLALGGLALVGLGGLTLVARRRARR